MIRVVRFRAGHLCGLVLQPAQAAAAGLIEDPAYARNLEASHAATVLSGDGTPIACAGLAPTHAPHCAYAWALFSTAVPRWSWPRIVRRMRAEIAAAGPRGGWSRIETHIDPMHRPSWRLMATLGFRPEGLVRNWYGDGRPAVLFGWCDRALPDPARAGATLRLAMKLLREDLTESRTDRRAA